MALYSVFIREGALASIPRSITPKHKILNFIRSLADDPFHRGHYIEHDALGRPNEVEIVAGYAVTYCADHAAKEIRVLNIEPADE